MTWGRSQLRCVSRNNTQTSSWEQYTVLQCRTNKTAHLFVVHHKHIWLKSKYCVPNLVQFLCLISCSRILYSLWWTLPQMTGHILSQIRPNFWPQKWFTNYIKLRFFSLSSKGYGFLNILLRSTFSLQYGQVCLFPTMHQPRMQNSWNLW